MKKAELLKQALENITQAMRGYENMPGDYFFDVSFDIAEARALVEALEGLRWAAMYESDERNQIGREHTNFEDADYLGRLAEGVDYIETVGILRLKDSQDEN